MLPVIFTLTIDSGLNESLQIDFIEFVYDSCMGVMEQVDIALELVGFPPPDNDWVDLGIKFISFMKEATLCSWAFADTTVELSVKHATNHEIMEVIKAS